MTTSFQEQVTTAIVQNGITTNVYAWSTAANWTHGVPGDGAAVTVNIPGSNPFNYDDISNLFLDNLNLVSGNVGVAGSLSIGTVSFGATLSNVSSDTLLGARRHR
jgi:hypothetical protein